MIKEFDTNLILIEGNPFRTIHKVNRNAIEGVLIELSLFLNISVMFTKTLDGTFERILKIENHFHKKEYYNRSGYKPKKFYNKQLHILQGLPMIGSVLSKRLLNYFGTVNYGIWILIVGLTGYIHTISFGIPSAMITLVSKTSNLNEKYMILKKSFYLLGIVSLFFLCLFLFFVYFDDNWIISILGNIDEELIKQTKNGKCDV